MAQNSKIEWTDHTFNPWVGCTNVSPGCDHCYAESWSKRSGLVKWGNSPRRRTSEAYWRAPMKWQAGAAAFRALNGRRQRVFCASLADDRPIWTENKAKLIERYLYYFVMITKHGAYIDGFAGPQYPGKDGAWAAKLVLESKPPFLRKFWLCETSQEKLPAVYDLAAASAQKGRSIKVVAGDFNANLGTILASGAITDKMATFCLLDQHTFECEWKSLQALAAHKTSNKIELFYFLATGWLDRAIAATTRNQDVLTRWWGADDWKELAGMRSFDRAQLFAGRFKSELKYKHAHAWPIYDKEEGARRVMYHMIHASDHDEAPKLMSRAYRKANEPKEDLANLQQELFGAASFHKV